MSPSPVSFHTRAFTLIETTLVVSILLGLITVVFIGVGSYREGVNRAQCIKNVANAQQALRSFCNIYEIEAGESHPDMREKLIGSGKMIPVTPHCPSYGFYSIVTDTEGGVIPGPGIQFMECSIADHKPSTTSGW